MSAHLTGAPRAPSRRRRVLDVAVVGLLLLGAASSPRSAAAQQYLQASASFTNNDNQNVALCAASCFAATYAHATVPYFSLDQPRSVRLVYHGDRVAVRPFVYADVSLASGAPTVQEYWLEAKVSGAAVTFLNGDTRLRFTGSQAAVRLAGQFDASARATGMYPLELTVGAVYGGGSSEQRTVTTTLMVVNERQSSIARGWTVGGVQRLHVQGDGSALVTDGDGSGAHFLVYSNNAWTSPAGDFTALTASGSGTSRVYTRAYPDSTKARFNSTGRMTSLTDRFGNAILFDYDASGRLDRIGDPFRTFNGTSYTVLTYGTHGLASIREPGTNGQSGSGRTTTITVASDSTLRVIKDPDGDSTRFAYDGSRRLATVTDRRGGATDFHYDAQSWKLDSIRQPQIVVGSSQSVRPTTRLVPWQTVGVPTASTQSTLAQVVSASAPTAQIRDPKNNLTSLAVDRWGQPLEISDPLQRVTTITRSGIFPTRIVHASGGVDSMTHTGPFLTSVRRAGQNRVDIRYGAYGQPDSVSGTGWPARRIFLGTGGRTDSVRLGGADSLKWRYTYDPRGRLLNATDPAGHVTTHRYESQFGNLDSTGTAGGRYSRTRFDGYGRDSVRSSSGAREDFLTHDVMNRVLSIHRLPIQATTQYAYDQLFLTRVQDANGNVHRFAHNALGWTTRRYDPADTLNRYEAFEYDENGNATARVNRRGQRVSLAYDVLNRLTAKSGTNTSADSLAYTTDDRILVGWNAVSRDSVFRSATGWTDSVVTRLGTKRFRRHYRPTALLDLDSLVIGSNTNITFVGRRYLRHSQTDLLAELRVNGQSSTLTQRRDLAVGQRSWPGGASRTDLWSTVGRPYDQSYGTQVLDSILGRGYGFDAGGRIEATLRANPSGSGVLAQRFGYDGGGRLISFDERTYSSCPADSLSGYACGQYTAQAAYTYDLGGNRIDGGALQYAAGNRITSAGSWTYTHDLDGHRASKSDGGTTTSYHWSAEGRLDSVTTGNGFTRYDYNAFGQLVRRWSSRNAIDRHYLWDGADLLAELDGTASQRIVEYVSGGGVDVPLAVVTGSYSPTLTRYVAQDELGNVVGVMNGTGVDQQVHYSPWGAPTVTGDTINRRLWKGLLWEGGRAGLYYVRNRWYDPEIGRFVSEDPAGVVASRNLYVFGMNDPINHADPSGAWCELKNAYEADERLMCEDIRPGDFWTIRRYLGGETGRSAFNTFAELGWTTWSSGTCFSGGFNAVHCSSMAESMSTLTLHSNESCRAAGVDATQWFQDGRFAYDEDLPYAGYAEKFFFPFGFGEITLGPGAFRNQTYLTEMIAHEVRHAQRPFEGHWWSEERHQANRATDAVYVFGRTCAG